MMMQVDKHLFDRSQSTLSLLGFGLSYVDTHSDPALPLGGHLLHALLIGGGAIIFIVLVIRLYWQEFKRTGTWSLKDLDKKTSREK